jgi:hypothetical protein
LSLWSVAFICQAWMWGADHGRLPNWLCLKQGQIKLAGVRTHSITLSCRLPALSIDCPRSSPASSHPHVSDTTRAQADAVVGLLKFLLVVIMAHGPRANVAACAMATPTGAVQGRKSTVQIVGSAPHGAGLRLPGRGAPGSCCRAERPHHARHPRHKGCRTGQSGIGAARSQDGPCNSAGPMQDCHQPLAPCLP